MTNKSSPSLALMWHIQNLIHDIYGVLSAENFAQVLVEESQGDTNNQCSTNQHISWSCDPAGSYPDLSQSIDMLNIQLSSDLK